MGLIPLAIRQLLWRFGLGRVIYIVVQIATLAPLWKWIFRVVGTGLGFFTGLAFWLIPSLWEQFYKIFLAAYKKAMTNVAAPIAHIMTQITGLGIGSGTVKNVITGVSGPPAHEAIGADLAKLFDDIFNVSAVADGYKMRLPGGAERNNFERFLGQSFRMQAGSIAATLFKDRIPFGMAGGLDDIGDRIEKIFGLEDAFEETLEPLMEKLIVEGMTQKFNRDTLPTDLSPADAIEAYNRLYIGDQVLKAILDNAGIRDDIRPHLINLRAKNLTQSDFQDLYQWGTWTWDDVFANFRTQGYLQDDARHKANLVTGDRAWKLKNELLNVRESQFVAGVLDEQAFRSFLATMNFSQVEEDLEIEIAKGKASLSKTAKPKQITGTFNVAPWRVRPGATAMMTWNIRNADTITISGIGAVGPRGERVIQPDLSQTYVLEASSDTDRERFEAAVQVGETRELKRPTASFSASPGRIQIGTPVELKWSTSNADSVSIDQVGAVAEAGAMPVFPFLSTIYTLRATNAQGTTIRQDIVFVEVPDILSTRDQRPAISFTITPGVITKAQPRSEVKWSITRAEGGTITFPDGSTRDVGRNGAFIITSTESGIYTLRASNIFGETQNQEAVIKKEPLEDEPPPPPGTTPPVVTLSVSPGTATPGENLSVFWTIAGATVGTLIFPDATSRQVGASGSQSYVAPSAAGTYEFRLQATNEAGPSQQSVIIVVSTAG